MARRECEDHDGEGSGESDETERESRMGALVKLPPERYLQHLPADYAEDTPECVETKVAEA
jgi:hypothetical protein